MGAARQSGLQWRLNAVIYWHVLLKVLTWPRSSIHNCSTRLNDGIPAQNNANRLIRRKSASCRRANHRSNAGEQIGAPL